MATVTYGTYELYNLRPDGKGPAITLNLQN